MFGNTLQRAIGRELGKVFALTLSVLTAILVLAGMLSEAAQFGLTPAELLATIPLIVPNLMPYTIPAATLFASCLVYGRLSQENEIIAVRSAGVNLSYVVWPAVLLGVGATAATWGLYYHVIPTTQYRLRTQWLSGAEDLFYRMVRNGMCGEVPGLGYRVWARDVQGRQLIDPVFKRPDGHGDYDVVGHAQTAELSIDPEHYQLLVRLKQGEILNMLQGTRVTFMERTLPLRLPECAFLGATGPSPREMTIPQLWACRETALQQIAWLDAAGSGSGDAEECESPSVAVLDRNREWLRSGLRKTDVQLNLRPAVAFSCLCFVLIGCPLGIWFRRGDYLSTFVACFIPIVGCYYPLLLGGIHLSERGGANPVVALWMVNALFLTVALVLLARLVRR